MVAIVLEEVDFDDPTTNVRGRCALAIAKPTPRGYWPRRSTINLTTKVYSCKQLKNKQKYDKSNLNIANMYEVLIMVGIRKVVLVWSLDTNEAHEVAMANF